MTQSTTPSSAAAIAFVLIRFWALTTALTVGFFSLVDVVQMIGALIAHGVTLAPS